MHNYYVYVYIDPRNFEEFYYGKGKGSRKDAHLDDASDSRKARRIAEIRKEGLEPIIRVIAGNLSEQEALLVEKTLLWKLGKLTTNIATGHFKDKFRPLNTLHKELPGFDFQNGIYYYNIGEGPHRNWEDYCKFGFISAGQGKRWGDAMQGFNKGDVVAAYLKGKGFVGIGKIKERAKMIKDVVVGNKPLLSLPLRSRNMSENCHDPVKSEYVSLVDWLKKVSSDKAKTRKRPKLYTTTHIRASLNHQPETVKFLEEQFKITLRDYLV